MEKYIDVNLNFTAREIYCDMLYCDEARSNKYAFVEIEEINMYALIERKTGKQVFLLDTDKINEIHLKDATLYEFCVNYNNRRLGWFDKDGEFYLSDIYYKISIQTLEYIIVYQKEGPKRVILSPTKDKMLTFLNAQKAFPGPEKYAIIKYTEDSYIIVIKENLNHLDMMFCGYEYSDNKSSMIIKFSNGKKRLLNLITFIYSKHYDNMEYYQYRDDQDNLIKSNKYVIADNFGSKLLISTRDTLVKEVFDDIRPINEKEAVVIQGENQFVINLVTGHIM